MEVGRFVGLAAAAAVMAVGWATGCSSTADSPSGATGNPTQEVDGGSSGASSGGGGGPSGTGSGGSGGSSGSASGGGSSGGASSGSSSGASSTGSGSSTGGSGGGPSEGGAPMGDDGGEGGTEGDAGTPPDGAFVHPGVLNTKAQLDFMKQQVAAGAQPWKGAADALIAAPQAKLGYQPKPRAMVACGSGGQPDDGCSDETNDSQAVYAHALLWIVTGNEQYAKDTANILDSWSAVLMTHGMSNAPLQVGWTGGGFVRAAEILRYTYPQWDASHVAQFSHMMNTAFLPLIENYKNYHTNGNWDDVMIEVMISIAVFDDNHTLFDEAVARYKKRLPAYIYATADGPKPIPPDPSITNLTTFWYNQTTYMDGLCQETCRDLRHVQHGFGGLIQTAEIAWHQGVDLYAERENRLLTGMEFHAQYVLGAAVPSDLCKGVLNSTDAMPSWEIAYNHYNHRKNLPMPQSAQVVTKNSPETAVQHMMWGTLTHHGAP